MKLFIVLLALANSVVGTNYGCQADNCARGVTGTGAHIKQPVETRKADCSSFQHITVSCGEKTITATTTVTYTLPAYYRRAPVEVGARNNNPPPAGCQTITPTYIPAYATYCENSASRYSSACSCWGITPYTTTVPQATKTETTTVYETVCPTKDKKQCGNKCYDLKTSEEHCGTCDIKCGKNQKCKNGKCEWHCPNGLKDCGYGQCKNLQWDEWNCGSCGKTCEHGQKCKSGHCTCPKNGDVLCTPSYGSPTCTSLNTNENCGACNKVCPHGQNCKDKTCKCPGGKTACGNDCVNTQSDVNNCGGCGKKCNGYGATCNYGTCSTPYY